MANFSRTDLDFLLQQISISEDDSTAQLDGILRAHQIWPQGLVRDTAVYSITANEWPAVKRNLQFLIERGANKAAHAAHTAHTAK